MSYPNTNFYSNVTAGLIDSAAKTAGQAFETLKTLPVESRIAFFNELTIEIAAVRNDAVLTAMKETNLPEARLNGELDRTIKQIRLFAEVLKEGSWVNAVIDTALPDRSPVPKPDIRQMQRPLGVVTVYGASNFPFAFSVAGGDTVSALAAGCPVLYKVHSGHPETSAIISGTILRAAKNTGMPEGIFTAFQADRETAMELVKHPLVKAVGFTGSYTAGKALYDAAVARKEPIPVYAEMGSVNPVFLLPGKLNEAPEELASALVASNILGTGQFCTNPGIIIMLQSEAQQQFQALFQQKLAETTGGAMLTKGIADAYAKGTQKLAASPGVTLAGKGSAAAHELAAVPQMFTVSGSVFLADKTVAEECFGPSSVHIIADDEAQLLQVAREIEGQLTISAWANDADFKKFEGLFRILETKAGRLMINNAPTGVEVTHAMVHGGPFPATTDSRSTSVGTTAIYRFTRPVCYQNYPDVLLPDALKSTNPLDIWRKVDGAPTK
jgi:alpha-ketoglutaric semialdehyde dehydrogenase